MSNEVWLVKQGAALLSTDKESAKTIADMEDGECGCFELIGMRDPVSFRKYWVMNSHIAKHVRQIEIDRVNRQPVYMRIFSREDASDAIKLGIGFFTTMPVGSTDYAIRKVKSISYASMSPNKWKYYIKRVAPFVVKKVMPEIQDPYAKDELVQIISKWLREVEAEGAREEAA